MKTPAYLFFSTAQGDTVSGVIRDTGDGKTSHAGIIYWSIDFVQWMVIDAGAGGWQPRALKEFLRQGNELVAVYQFPKYDLFQGVYANRDIIGVPYDWNALVGRGVQKWLWKVFRKKLERNYWNEAGKYYCNEIIAARIFPRCNPPIPIATDGKVDMDPFQLCQLVSDSNIAEPIADPRRLFAEAYPP